MNTAQHLIHIFAPLLMVVNALCVLVLLYGGWPRPGEPRVRPTRIQHCTAVSMFISMAYFLLETILQEWNLSLSSRGLLVMYWVGDISLIGVLLQSVFLRQQSLRLREWSLVLVPALLNLVIILIWGNSHPVVVGYVGYALYAYILIMYGFCLWRLRQWDRQIEEEFSDITHKQTRWYRQLTMPIMLLVLMWIPATFLPHGEWVWVVYFPLLAVVIVYSTSFVLTQEEFEFSSAEDSEESAEGMVPDSKSEENPVWVRKLEDLMTVEKRYHDPELTLTMLSREIGVNRTYLSQYINQTKGLSFCQYINDYRLYEAETLLRTTDLPVDAIAQQCGFSSSHVFRRSFREKNSLTPSNWRKQG